MLHHTSHTSNTHTHTYSDIFDAMFPIHRLRGEILIKQGQSPSSPSSLSSLPLPSPPPYSTHPYPFLYSFPSLSSPPLSSPPSPPSLSLPLFLLLIISSFPSFSLSLNSMYILLYAICYLFRRFHRETFIESEL